MTPEELRAAQHLLAHYGVAGFPRAGSFTTRLIECMEAADPSNRARLLYAFPEFRQAVAIATTIGVEELEKLVRKQEAKR